MKHRFTVDCHEGLRLDKFLVEQLPDLSRSEIQTNIMSGRTWVNGNVVTKKGLVLADQDVVELEIAVKAITGISEDIPLDIRYEDQWLMVVNKPVGMVVHPAPGNHSGTLVNALLGYGTSLSDLGGDFRPGIVHRLDKLTSGLLLIAKTNSSHRQLADLLKEREIKRTYLALVTGPIQQIRGTITGPIGRHPRQRTKMAVVEQGKPAMTDFRVLHSFPKHTLVEVNLQTGRTHQIRVHFSHMGRPVAGDTVYGKGFREIKYSGQMLHARTLNFIHPVLEKRICITAEPPGEFIAVLRRLNGGGDR